MVGTLIFLYAPSCPPPADSREYVEAGNACNNLELKAPEAAASWLSSTVLVAVLCCLLLMI
jgi:hypothetical protein